MKVGKKSKTLAALAVGLALIVLGSVLALGIPCTLIANICFVKSSCYVKPTTTCILSALEVVVSTIVGVALFRETLTPRRWRRAAFSSSRARRSWQA